MQMKTTWLYSWAELCLFQRQIALLTFAKCLCLSCNWACLCLFWPYFVFVLYSPTTNCPFDFWQVFVFVLYLCVFMLVLIRLCLFSCTRQRQIALLTFGKCLCLPCSCACSCLLRYESSTLILCKELSSPIFQSLWVRLSGMRDTLPDFHFVQYIKA